LANPADNGHSYINDLQILADDFPQSGLLRAMLARAEGGLSISHAAAYFNPRALYILVNSSESLAVVSGEQIVTDASARPVADENELADQEAEVHEIIDPETNETGHFVNAEPVAEEINKPITVIADDERQEVESIDHAVNTEPFLIEYDEVVDEDIEATEAEEIIELPVEEPVTSEDIYAEQVSDHETGEVVELPSDETEPLAQAHTKEDSEDVAPIIITSENASFYEDELVTEAGVFEEEQQHENVQVMPADEEVQEVELTIEAVTEHKEPQKDIDDDIYDEIVGIDDISFAPVTRTFHEPVIQAEENPTGNIVSEENTNKDRALNLDDEAEKLIVGNIAATDYFVFDRAISERKQPDIVENEQVNGAEAPALEHQEVSKYHDDKMPYTFMWWLDKTRREHAGIYQPFKLDTSQAIHQSGAQELQQQYYENIFHLNSVEELDRSTSSPTIEFDMKTKEDRIIKRFIVEEPHISPPSSDKLDNENKAKKSAEDQDEMVTETLARIYSDQMLYHKAINTYKKLMLKFPEKSRYFADQIEQLERKIN